MRLFIAVLVLFFSFQSWTKADDIRDFEIEGMSIGDSLLDHYSRNEIDEALKNPTYYKNKEYVEIFLNLKNNEYDHLQVAFQPNDKRLIIEKIMLIKNFQNKIEECKKEKEKIINDSLEFFGDSVRSDDDRISKADTTGNSFVYISTFRPSTGGFFNIACKDYGQEMFEANGWLDSLTLSIGSNKINKFLLGDPY